MVKYIIKRLLLSVLILVGVSIIIYVLIRLMPMDYIDQKFQAQLAQGTVTEEDLARIKDLYGLRIRYEVYCGTATGTNALTGNPITEDLFFGVFNWDNWDPNLAEASLTSGQQTLCAIVSYIEGYGNWLGNALQGDLGQSFKYADDVVTVISNSMWVSFGITLVSTVLEFVIAIPLGIQAAVHQYGAFDYTVTVISMMGISLPTFFLGVLLLGLFSLNLGWFPYQGLTDATRIFNNGFEEFLDMIHHLVLPIVTLVILSIGSLMRYTRTNMLEVLNADYIRTARAKGCSEKTVIYHHAFRNTLIPIVTMLAGILPGMFGGAMITEQVFSLPGIGNKAYQALVIGDVPFVMGYNMFLAILTVLGTLLSDLMYAVVDPRVKITK